MPVPGDILGHEGTTIDPIIAVVVFDELQSGHEHHWLAGAACFVARIGIGVAAAGVLVLWLLLK